MNIVKSEPQQASDSPHPPSHTLTSTREPYIKQQTDCQQLHLREVQTKGQETLRSRGSDALTCGDGKSWAVTSRGSGLPQGFDFGLIA